MEKLKLKYNSFKTNYNIDEKVFIVLAISIFLPYFITALVMIGVAIYALIKKDVVRYALKSRKNIVIYIFCLYSLIVSTVAENWIGFAISIGLFLIFNVIIYYEKIVNKKLFEKMIDVMIFMSLISVGYAIIEQFFYFNPLEGYLSYFDIDNKPEFRVHAFYFNANYYALILIFVEIMCLYKALHSKDRRIFYICASLANFFALYLTGSRTGWIALIFALIIIFALSNRIKEIMITLGVGFVMVVATVFNLPIIPRLTEYGTGLGRRQQIYDTAVLMIKDNPLFGKGPLTYLYQHEDYLSKYINIFGNHDLGKLGIASQHAHSIFLEPFVSFGVIGSFLLFGYLLISLMDVLLVYS
ncbi:MAG: O-antigen ligase family protein, partial [Erysipelotrichales bacterium]